MKNATQDLIKEHGVMMLLLAILEKIALKIKSEEEVSTDHLNKILEFIQNFGDKCHHSKEEDILFQEMLKYSNGTKDVNELLGEHMSGRDYVKGIAESIKNYQKGNPDSYHIATNMEGYIRLYQEHIRKENTIVFPIAEKEIPEEVQEEMGKKYETFEKEIMGEGVHEKYHSLLEELKAVYLT